jgi:DNA polymerase-1
MTVALIDGDIVAYRAAIADQRGYNWGDGVTSAVVDNQSAAEAALQTIDAWAAIAGSKKPIVCFSVRHNFRKLVLPTYKANRSPSKPLAYVYTVNAVRDRFECREVDGLEADDLLGILATTDKYRDAVILTLDKDLRTVPGRHLNSLKEDEPVTVTPEQATRKWLMQALHGDPTDGYGGIHRVGPAKAATILDTPSPTNDLARLWSRVVGAYRKAGQTEATALTMTRVARILQRSDYDKDTKEILLWHPTNPTRLPLATVCGASTTTALSPS